jgi:hypothetical protein
MEKGMEKIGYNEWKMNGGKGKEKSEYDMERMK